MCWWLTGRVAVREAVSGDGEQARVMEATGSVPQPRIDTVRWLLGIHSELHADAGAVSSSTSLQISVPLAHLHDGHCSGASKDIHCSVDRAFCASGRSVLVDGMKRIEQQCADLVRMCRQAYTPDLLEAAALQLESTTAVLKLLSAQRSRETGSF